MQSRHEEWANSLSHGLGLLAAIASAPLLIVAASHHGSVATMVGASIFSATLILLYLCSTLYHGLQESLARRVFAKLDHGSIYLFIAGSYTPFAIGLLRDPSDWLMFAIVWALAAIGLLLKLFNCLRHPWLSTALYLGMGWLVLMAALPLLRMVSAHGVVWLLAGGFAYTTGIVFFLTDHRLRFGHFIWHLFVMTGSACHYCAIFWYAT